MGIERKEYLSNKKESEESKESKEYYESETVNGIEISVGWDEGYDMYTIDFPQIDISYAWDNEEGVSDQIIMISKDPEVAKKVFDYAVQVAQDESDVYEVFRKAKAFLEKLPRNKK